MFVATSPSSHLIPEISKRIQHLGSIRTYDRGSSESIHSTFHMTRRVLDHLMSHLFASFRDDGG